MAGELKVKVPHRDGDILIEIVGGSRVLSGLAYDEAEELGVMLRDSVAAHLAAE